MYEDGRYEYDHECEGCGASFKSHRKDAIYCSQKCSGKYGGKKAA